MMRIATNGMAALAALLASAGIATAQVTPHIIAPADADQILSPFYAWTKPVPARPGTMMRSEALSPALWVPGSGSARRILYSSTDGVDGKTPIAVSGVVFMPPGTPPAGGWPVVIWGHGTVGVADTCAPSWAGRSWRDMRYLSEWMKQGFAIVATDYQGLGTRGMHPYLATRPVGYSLLDSARAAIRADKRLANRAVLVGQSQGGAAVIAAAGLAPTYAPDLNLLGTVATGTGVIAAKAPPPGAPPVASSPDVDATSAYGLYLALALSAQDPGFKLDRVVTARALPVLNQAATRCIDSFEYDVLMAGINWGNAFTAQGLAATVKHYPQLNAPTYAIPTPMFIGTGEKDIDVDPARQVELADRLCAAGTRVTHHIYKDVDHSGAVNLSLRDSLPFVRRLLAGQPVAPTCPAKG